jgi:hypothetical protein
VLLVLLVPDVACGLAFGLVYAMCGIDARERSGSGIDYLLRCSSSSRSMNAAIIAR